MLNQTTITALQSLLYVALDHRGGPVPPAEIAAQLGASPAYLAKINTQLAKANILKSFRGVRGGVMLAQPPERITLLQVVEACQGIILGDYCSETDDIQVVCGFHAAMYELRQTFVRALEQWTLADLAKKPLPNPEIRPLVHCRMSCACHRGPTE